MCGKRFLACRFTVLHFRIDFYELDSGFFFSNSMMMRNERKEISRCGTTKTGYALSAKRKPRILWIVCSPILQNIVCRCSIEKCDKKNDPMFAFSATAIVCRWTVWMEWKNDTIVFDAESELKRNDREEDSAACCNVFGSRSRRNSVGRYLVYILKIRHINTKTTWMVWIWAWKSG